MDTTTSWAADSQRIGAWIYIDLRNYYQLDKLLVRRRFNYAGYNFEAEASQISLQFSDGVIKHANLGKKGLSRIKIKGADKTRSVNITITKVYQEFTHSEKSNVGFSEIEFCGAKVKGSFMYTCYYSILHGIKFPIYNE